MSLIEKHFLIRNLNEDNGRYKENYPHIIKKNFQNSNVDNRKHKYNGKHKEDMENFPHIVKDNFQNSNVDSWRRKEAYHPHMIMEILLVIRLI